ncbi:MAG: helix-hairpin-helix domain-containing protein [Burkholderiales bacterium]
MPFPEAEKHKLRALKGVGDTVISRLEQIGFSSLSQLVDEDPLSITKQISQMMGSTCWHNSPQARAAISAVVALAVHEASPDISPGTRPSGL